MRYRPAWGLALRGMSTAAIAAIIATVPGVAVQPAVAAEPEGGLSVPSSAWAPPAELNRTPAGGAPPGRPWGGEAGVASVPCDENVATGILRQYPFERFPVSDRSELLVNTHNGNVVITARDLSIRGTGQNLSLSHVYNSKLPGAGAFGTGWSLNTGPDLGLTFDGGDVVLHGESGYCARYSATDGGGYTPAPGVPAELERLDNGNYELTFNDDKDVWMFDAQGWLLSQADRNDNVNTVRYTSAGLLASITDSQGRVTTVAYDDAGRITKLTDPTGTTAGSYRYNQAGQLAEYTDRDGKTTYLQYDAAGNLTLLEDPAHKRTRLLYDGSDRVVEVRIPGRSGTSNTRFDYQDGQTVETDANGHQITYKFDDQGRQIEAVDALGHSRKQTWTANSDVAVTTDGLNNNTTRSYDELNNLISTELPTGATTSIGYTDTAHPRLPTSVTDPQGNQLTRDYDDAGNLLTIHSEGLDADLQVNTYNEPNGTLATRTDGKGAVTRFEYDQAGNLTKEISPAPMGVTRYTYDSLSRITSVTDGNRVCIGYTYDKLDRIVAISRNGYPLQTNTYDAIGNLTERSVPGVATRFLWAKTSTASQPISAQRIEGGSVESVGYRYDAVGNLTQLGDAGGYVNYTYDKANRLTALQDPFGQTTTFAYDAADRRTETTFPAAGAQRTGYDASGRQTSLTVTNTGGADKLKATYSYTRPGGGDSDLLQSKTIAGTTTDYTYDSLRRLTHAGTADFGYDNANNMTNRDGLGFTINPADQFTQVGNDTITFDQAGNVTGDSGNNTRFTYSPTNQLIKGHAGDTEILDVSYDSADQTQRRHITETTGTGDTYTHVLGHTALGTTQVTTDGQRTSYTRDPDGTLITQKAADGTRYNLITDYQGSVLALLGTNGELAATYTYSPYGTVNAQGPAAGKNHFRWIGTYQLHGGLNLTGHRYYNPTWGRFTQPDPTKQETNPYTYAQCDPANQSDPSGAAAISSCLASNLGAVATAGSSALGVVGFAAAVTAVSTAGVAVAIGGLAFTVVGAVATTPPSEACK